MPTLRSCRILAVVATFVFCAPAAFAGPPLICHPFVVDSASPLLPWAAGREWRLPHPDYDVASLTADTLALLSVDAPILSRMENLRRATIYADQDPAVAEALLAAVLARIDAPTADPHVAALAWFDAGYLVETYRQLGLVYQHGMLTPKGRGVPMLSAAVAGLDGLCVHPKSTRARARAARRARFRCVIDDAGAIGRNASPPSRSGRRTRVDARAQPRAVRSRLAPPTLRSSGMDVAS